VLTRREPSPPFSEDDVDYLKSLSERLALLLDNAALLDDAARALTELGASKSFYSALLAHATDMVTIIDGAGAVRWASPSASRVLGYSPEEFLGHDNLNLVHLDDRARVAVRLGEMLAGGQHGETDRFRMRRKDGSWCWVETSVSDARQDPAVRGIVVNARDVTEEVNSRREVEERSRGQQEVLDSMPMSTALLDAEGTVVATNAAWRRFATRNGGSEDCGDHQNYFAVCVAAGDPLSLQVHDGLRAVLRSEVPEFTLVLPCPSPTSDRWYQMHIAPLTAGGGGAVVYYVDITKNKQYAAEMAHRAAHDYLTGLPNRVALVAALRDALVSHEGRESGLAVLFCDLDQFKLVNDSYGHEAATRCSSRSRSACAAWRASST
jgi:PAS domain S-box-containing protein